MLMSDYTAELLNLEDVIITGVENISDQLHIYIELPRKKHICPACGASTDRIHDYRLQTIKDVPLARDTFLHLRKRRYRCSCGKRFFEHNPFLPRYYRVTSRLVAQIIQEFRKIIPTEYNTISYYEEAAYYMDNGSDGGAHFLYVYYADQSFSYDALYDNEVPWLDADRETVESALAKYPVLIPDCAEFTQEGEGWHSFRVDQYIDGAVMLDGTLRIRYDADGTIRNIDNDLLAYTYYDVEKIITAEEAYKRLCKGKFNDGGRFAYESPEAVTVASCALRYMVDTKGFYQPVYRFEVASLDGSYAERIMIPAMR